MNDDRRRLAIAVAAAIAVHEVLAGLFPWHGFAPKAVPTPVVTIARLTRIVRRPVPTPPPTPRPTPRPIPVPVHRIAPTHVIPHHISPAHAAKKQRVKRVAKAPPKTVTHYHSKPIAHIPVGSQGAGTAVHAAATTGSIGTGGTGTGQSGNGNGTAGAPPAQEPCGYVDFMPTTGARVDGQTGTITEHIEITVHFPDGSSQSIDLDYPWTYPSRAADPFLPGNQDVPATFQFPPAPLRATEPPLVQYVIDHTTPDGFTKLADCPGQ